MDSVKWINLIEMKKEQVSWLIFERFFKYYFGNNLYELLFWKINVLDSFNIVDFCYITKYYNSDLIQFLVKNVRY